MKTRILLVDGFEVMGGRYDGIKMNGDHNTIRNCWVHNNKAMGIAMHHQNRIANNTKIMYGPPFRSRTDAEKKELVDKFWRDVLGGTAAARCHREFNGLGLNDLARVQIRSARIFTDAWNVFSCEPRNDLLSERAENEAYCMAQPGRQYAVYLPDGGTVRLDVSAAESPLQVRWFDIAQSTWQSSRTAAGGNSIELKAPGEGPWAALIVTQH